MTGQNIDANAGAPAAGAAPGDQPAPPGAIDADDIPIRLVFIAGDTEVALRDLQRIAPGYVFKLQQPVDRHVTVRANGKTIGSGELVEVDGRVGVRLLTCNRPSVS